VRVSRECNFAGRLVERLGANSDLVDAATGQTIRAADVPSTIVGFAASFLAHGLRPGDRILISCGVNPASALAYLGAIYAGCIPVLVDERLLESSGAVIFTKASAKAVWSTQRVRCDWTRENGFSHITGNFEALPARSLRAAMCAESDLAALMPTSGSTGDPKLVMVTHGNLIANTEAIIRSQGLEADEKALLIMPVSYCFGTSIVHTHLYQGGGIVFDSRFMFPDKVLRAINQYRCTTFAGVPTVYNILLRRSHIASIALPGLRRFLQAGGRFPSASIEEFCRIAPGPRFLVMYGQTEATARISCLPADRLADKLGSAGLPLDNLAVRIVNDAGHEIPHGQIGEIQVSGPSVCRGYLDDPEASQSKFTSGWLRTGDIGSRDQEGYLWIEGRLAEFIKVRGLRVSFAEIEAKVATVPGVHECAVAGMHHPESGEALALFVVGSDKASTLQERVRRALPPLWTCSSIRVVPELPRTANGKIARSQLQTLE